jgi:hypothetical protein
MPAFRAPLQGPFLFLGETGAIGIDPQRSSGQTPTTKLNAIIRIRAFRPPTIRQLAWKKRRPIIWKFTEICLSLCELFGIIFCSVSGMTGPTKAGGLPVIHDRGTGNLEATGAGSYIRIFGLKNFRSTPPLVSETGYPWRRLRLHR